ncbi:MAG: response regulator [Nitrospiraceae bacterium]|nr:response regulator [Nitrospiraceae bacterium]
MTTENQSILLIDDDANYLTATRDLLETQGYTVETYNQAFGATALIQKMRPNLVLLDINMPGLSGENLARLLRLNDNTRHIPIVFHSSNDEDSLRIAVSRYRVTGYICKGNLFELRQKVAYYLRRSNN